MADTVRYLLEEMVPELEALEQRGYFSRSEIRSIVQKRQDFEYALKRMAAVKADYLRYIEYEEKLEELRESRRTSRAISGKKSLAEFCIVRRIHFIFERMLRKFRGDLELWSRWLRFCQSTASWRQMSKVLTKALQLHSGCAPLWTYAAAWEFEHNLNAAAARALMQRGLRMCKDTPGLWHEYFRLELLYALRLRERRRVLGIEDDGGSGKANGASSEGEGEEGEGGGGEGAADESAAAVAAVLNGAVAAVVYRSAIAAYPDSVPFRAKFLDMLHPLSFPGKAALEDAIYDSVARDFAGTPEAWDLRARRHMQALGARAPPAERVAALQAAVAVYEEGLAALPTPQMVALLLEFLQQQAAELEQDAAAGGGSSDPTVQHAAAVAAAEMADWLRQRALRGYREAEAAGLLSEQLRLEGIAFLLHHGDTEAAAAAARAAVHAFPHSAPLWQQLLVLEAVTAADELAASGASSAVAAQQQAGGGGSDEDEDDVAVRPQQVAALAGTAAASTQHSSAPPQRRLETLAIQSVQAVPASDAAPLWLTALNVLCSSGCSLQGLCEQLVQAALRQSRGPVEGGLGAVAAALLSALHQSGGIGAARSLYRVLLPLPPPGGDFFRRLLQLEAQLSATEAAAAAAAAAGGRQSGSSKGGQALSDRQLQDLFEAACDAYGADDVQLWLLYAEWQASRGGVGAAAQVYWKARKVLKQPEELEAAHQLKFKLKPT